MTTLLAHAPEEILNALDSVTSLAGVRAREPELRALRPELAALAELSLEQINQLDRRAQALFHDLLLESVLGPERDALFSAAYTIVPSILAERRRRANIPVDRFGVSSSSAGRIADELGARGQRVLDVGCGTGILVEELTKLGFRARGVELSRVLYERGVERIAANGGDPACLSCADFLRMDVATLLDQGPYDLLWSNDVFEHIHPDETREFLGRCHRLLAARGRLWLTTPSGLSDPGDKTLHLKQYYLHELLELGRAAGFSGFRCRLLGSRRRWLWPANSARQSFVTLKLGAEPLLKQLPLRRRQRAARMMAYSELFLLKK